MGYYVSTMIGIRTGGVFGGASDVDDMKARIRNIIADMNGGLHPIDISLDDPSHCMSRELVSHKGSYVVIAGVFNSWTYDHSSVFASNLSKEFGTEVMIMSWDEETGNVRCNIFLDGKELFEVSENPIGRIIRRVT